MSKIFACIISQNQIEYIEPVLSSLKNFEFERVWGLDRCTDHTNVLLDRLKEVHIDNRQGTGFLAGFMRDLLITHVDYLGADRILFLDGDRALVYEDPKQFWNTDILSDDVVMLKAIQDFRDTQDRSIFKSLATAGVCVSMKHIHKVRALSVMNGRCFHADLDAIASYEDTLFGELLYRVGANLRYSNLARVSGSLIPSKLNFEAAKGYICMEKILRDLGGYCYA
jgi:hypothetical protein